VATHQQAGIQGEKVFNIGAEFSMLQRKSKGSEITHKHSRLTILLLLSKKSPIRAASEL